MFAIVRDEKRLALLCSSIGAETTSLHENMHVAVISSLVKAAEGGIQPLRMLWPNLSEQYRRNLKAFHRRINAHLFGDDQGLHGDANSFLMFTDGNWYLRQKTEPERKAFVELAETVLINPSGDVEDRFGKKWLAFWDAGYIPRVAIEFKDGALLKALKRLRDTAEIGNTNPQGVVTKTSLISPEVRQELNISIAKIEQAMGIEADQEGFGPVFNRTAMILNKATDPKKVKPILTPAIQATELSASVDEINKGRKRPLNKKDTEAVGIVG